MAGYDLSPNAASGRAVTEAQGPCTAAEYFRLCVSRDIGWFYGHLATSETPSLSGSADQLRVGKLRLPLPGLQLGARQERGYNVALYL